MKLQRLQATTFPNASAHAALGHSRLSLLDQGWKICWLRQSRKLVPAFDGAKHGKT
jgi:hypothetical protein